VSGTDGDGGANGHGMDMEGEEGDEETYGYSIEGGDNCYSFNNRPLFRIGQTLTMIEVLASLELSLIVPNPKRR
jgi:hypothetical protein